MEKLLLALYIATFIPWSSAVAREENAAAQQATAETSSFNQLLDELTANSINKDPELRSILGLSDDGIGDLSHLMSPFCDAFLTPVPTQKAGRFMPSNW